MKLINLSLLLGLICLTGLGQQVPDQPSAIRDCEKIGLDKVWAETNDVSCYLIPVERNFTTPRGETYSLAVAVAPALNAAPKEPLLYLHGGPGIATLGNMPRYLQSKTFSQLRENHALIFFDYRGTGFSEPSLCPALSLAVGLISNAKQPRSEMISKTTSAYANCRDESLKHGVHLSDFSSLQSAADAETIRQNLGIKHWNIYSVSHGTTVALNMMRSFPNHIRSVILDSPFPPHAPWMDFIHPFDSALKDLQARLKRDPKLSRLFPSLLDDFAKVTNRLRKIPGSTQGAESKYAFNDGDFAWTVWSAMLNPKTIPQVPLALKEMAAGNDEVLSKWVKQFNSPDSFGKFALAQSKAILLFESKPRFEKETEKYLLKNFPHFAGFIEPGLEAALIPAFRPDSPSREYFKPVRSDIPTLVFAGEFDPVCPPSFARATAKTLTNASIIVVPDASHAAIHADDCTRSIGKEFYLNPAKKPVVKCLAERKPMEFVTSETLTHPN